jgi:hypothetical protein
MVQKCKRFWERGQLKKNIKGIDKLRPVDNFDRCP